MEQNEIDPKVAMFTAALIALVALTYYSVETISDAMKNKVIKVYHQQEDGTFIHVE